MTIHYKCDNPSCGDPNQEIRATTFTEEGLYTSASGRTCCDSPGGGLERDFWASSEACADAIDALYPEP